MNTPLEQSIIHWETNLQHAKEGHPARITYGVLSCPLCKANPSCESCPVMIQTDMSRCNGTPYGAVAKLLESGDPDQEALVQAVQAEVNFLKSLLPED